MRYFLYSVKDDDFAFSQPFVYPTDALAIRAFVGSCRSESPNLANTNPEKKTLWRIAEFDDQTGSIISDYKPEQIAKAIDFVVSEEERAQRETARKVAEMQVIREMQEKIDGLMKQNTELAAALAEKGGIKCKKSKK